MSLYLILSICAIAFAKVPANSTICDYYASRIFTGNLTTGNQAADQLRGVILYVNLAFTGNNSGIDKNVNVQGILNNGTVNGTAVSLLKYFDGSLLSANRGGKATSVNFLDGGANAPFLQFMADTPEDTNQYLLGCSSIGTDIFPAYNGSRSMYSVHKYMSITPIEFEYFKSQLGLAAIAAGADPVDVRLVSAYYNSIFGRRCSPATSIVKGVPAEPQAICLDAACPRAAGAECGKAGGYDSDDGTGPAPVAAAKSGTSAPTTAASPQPSGNAALPTVSGEGTIMTLIAGLVAMGLMTDAFG